MSSFWSRFTLLPRPIAILLPLTLDYHRALGWRFDGGRWYLGAGQRRPDRRQRHAIAAMDARIESLGTQLTVEDQQIDQLHRLLAKTT